MSENLRESHVSREGGTKVYDKDGNLLSHKKQEGSDAGNDNEGVSSASDNQDDTE